MRSQRSFARRLLSRWWQILLPSLVLSYLGCEAIRHLIKPTFEAFEVVKTDLELIAARATPDAMNAADPGTKEVHAQRIKVAALKNKRQGQIKYLQLQNVEKTVATLHDYEAKYLDNEIRDLLDKVRQVTARLEELEFQARTEAYRVSKVDDAVAPKAPTNNRRIAFMAAVPVVVFVTLLAVFMVIESRPTASTSGGAPPDSGDTESG
jgi:hypothetical protein